jgi:intersectin
MEWAIPQTSKLRYKQMFNTTDKTRTGFLTGTQARGILVQTNVPQAVLAKIWTLSDLDADGRLTCEEFVLALYLCELYSTNKPVPTELPPELIPPTFRQIKNASSRTGSVVNSRHGSVSSQGAGEADPTAGMPQSKFSYFFFF